MNNMKFYSKITILLLLVSFIFTPKVNAQNKFASAGIAVGSNQFTANLGYTHLWPVTKNKKFKIGTGLHFTSNFASNRYFTTAPAKLTSGKTGPGVFFADNIVQNVDSVLFKKSQVNSLNLSINLNYQITKKLMVEFNIDAIGFSFGASQNATYFGNNNAPTINTTAKPTAFNLLLISDNDLGSLNSSLFFGYKLNKTLAIKSGVQFLFNEYTTATKVQTTPTGDKNDRFRNKTLAFEIGLIKFL